MRAAVSALLSAALLGCAVYTERAPALPPIYLKPGVPHRYDSEYVERMRCTEGLLVVERMGRTTPVTVWCI